MEKRKLSTQLKDKDTKKVYDEFYEHAMHLMNDHQQPLELVAGTMIAIAQRMYRTQLSEEEYNNMMDVIRDAPVKPYNVKKVRLQ
jgi:tRNA C32,U32 (ribose-2'-O)-methylase TrmJ|tara:strand:- start:506 stop:760 length:255 start_codon:yes stop_codon:yes gene_type:complete